MFNLRPISQSKALVKRGLHLIAQTGALVRPRLMAAWLQFRRHERRVVLEPYRRVGGLARITAALLATVLLALFCFIYGFFFAVSAPYLMAWCLVPIALVGLLIIWALPDLRKPPTFALELLLPSYFIFLLIWPEYLALTLPGMPWVTFTRMTGLPMVGFLLICLSVSADFRRYVSASVSAIKPLWVMLLGYVLVELLTIPLSPNVAASIQMIISEQIGLTAVFVVSAAIFRDIKYVERYWALLCAIAIPVCLLTIFEAREQHVPWAGHVPSFMLPPDPTVGDMLAPNFRPGINVYRAKANFRHPLALSEYLSLLTPFILHFMFTTRSAFRRGVLALMLPLIYYTVRLTDSRLGVVGMLVSTLLFGVLWSVNRWRRNRTDLLSAAFVFGYPAIFFGVIGLTFISHRLNMLVFGGNAQQSSSEARNDQLAMALPKLWSHPLGHGMGQSGKAMGFAKGAYVTVDNWFITVSMDFGIPGVIFWYGMFIAAIIVALKCTMQSSTSERPEARLMGPLAVGLSAFLIVKWVHGQSDTHPIQFMMLGMVSALCLRLRMHTAALATPSAAAPGRSPLFRIPRPAPAE